MQVPQAAGLLRLPAFVFTYHMPDVRQHSHCTPQSAQHLAVAGICFYITASGSCLTIQAQMQVSLHLPRQHTPSGCSVVSVVSVHVGAQNQVGAHLVGP